MTPWLGRDEFPCHEFSPCLHPSLRQVRPGCCDEVLPKAHGDSCPWLLRHRPGCPQPRCRPRHCASTPPTLNFSSPSPPSFAVSPHDLCVFQEGEQMQPQESVTHHSMSRRCAPTLRDPTNFSAAINVTYRYLAGSPTPHKSRCSSARRTLL